MEPLHFFATTISPRRRYLLCGCAGSRTDAR